MSTEIINFLEYSKHIPYAVIREHIIPYTYRPQTKLMLRDVRNYMQDDKTFIHNMYNRMCTASVLLSYILSYHSSPTRLVTIMMRHIQYKNCDSADVYKMVMNTYYAQDKTDILRKVSCIWGLMTPEERTDCINTYIICDE